MAEEATPAPPAVPAPGKWTGFALPCVVFGVALVLYHQRYLTFLASDQRVVGTDYAYFLPHMLAGDYWFARNGPFSVPWMSPAFCGGLPFYANPQSFYFSLAQWLSFVVDPLTAVRWTILVFAGAGAAGSYLLLRRSFRASVPASLLGGLVFMFNGFFSHRMLIGHFAFVSFMLVPLVAALLIGGRTTSSWPARGLGAGLLIAVMFQSGLVVLFGPCGLAVLFFCLLAAIRFGGGWQMLKATGIALVAASALSAAKFVGAAAFVSQFGRDFYPLPGVDRLSDLLSIAFRMLFGRADVGIDNLFRHGRVRMRLHEWEYGLSPVPLVVLALGLTFLLARRWRTKREAPAAAAPFDVRLLILGLLLLLPLALNYYSPGWNAFLREVPIIRSMQTLSRWFAFYVPVFAILAGIAVDYLPAGGKVPLVFVAMCAVIAFHFSEELTEAQHLPQRWYEATEVQQGWTELHQTGQPKPVTSLASRLVAVSGRADMINGENALAIGASSRWCYEPIFGYTLNKFPVQTLHEGPSLEVTDGDLNVKNAACFLYPAENDCRPGAHLPVSRQQDAEAFLDYRPLEWKTSALQQAANTINLLALFAVPGLLVWTLLRTRRARRA